jgi:diguanylate cyclase (GGDEF)-like protein
MWHKFRYVNERQTNTEVSMRASYPVLLVEDDPISRKILEKILKKEGFNVTAVENGRIAMEIFRDTFFPIVLTDWLMPEMEGPDLCRAIREQKPDSYVYIVLLTAKDAKSDIISGLEAGADDYLTKPANRGELVARIKNGLRILELEKSLKEANEEIKILSITDPLTGAYNRGYLNERLPQEIKRSMRYHHPLSLILCDIDHFKHVNDRFGHLAGDRVLKEFAQSIIDSVRNQIDWTARYGGEEFLIVLPETNFEGAMLLAERLCQSIAGQPFSFNEKPIPVTASFGVTGFSPDGPGSEISPETLLQQSDTCLYQAKNQGRNRVVGLAL